VSCAGCTARGGVARYARDAGSARTHERGITLLELLVAVAILGVIAGLLYGTFTRTLAGRDRASIALERYATARAALDWIERDLEGAFATGLFPSSTKRFFGSARADSPTEERAPLLDFTTTSALSVPPLTGPALPDEDRTVMHGDQIRAIYHLEKPADPDAVGLDLVRYEYRPPLRTELKDATRAVIAHGIASVELRYFDGSTWHEEWDSTGSSSGDDRAIAPRLVEARIRVANPGGEPVELVSAVYLTMGGRRRG
jgi:prepilin-type N-terminal cleavage/methylation domain-containing protein